MSSALSHHVSQNRKREEGKWGGSSFGGSQESSESNVSGISPLSPRVISEKGSDFSRLLRGSDCEGRDGFNGTTDGSLSPSESSFSQPGDKRPELQEQQCSASLQPKMLKQINSYHTKEDLLGLVSSCHAQLDEINLVTCVYRLARMYSSLRHPAARSRWSAELRNDNRFLQLLGSIQKHMLQAQLQLIERGSFKGLDAQCVSNLIWAMVKLDVSSEPGCPGYEVVQNASPLVMYFLSSSSSQGLANLLWAYSKMSVPLLDVMMMIVAEMANRLHCPEGLAQFDAQALSNSIWALAHMRSKASELDAICGSPGLTMHFVSGIAFCALNMLRGLRTRSDIMHMQASMQYAEKKFSCQALVNICWSLSSMLGEECAELPGIRNLFAAMRTEAMIRLRATTSALQLKQAWALRPQGGFNEQALANIAYAFDRAMLLDRALLQSVFGVAAMRLEVNSAAGLRPGFKPQELCTLLRAAQANIAQPWEFLGKLFNAITTYPQSIEAWSAAERGELQRAMALLDVYRSALMMKQIQVAQQEQQQQMSLQELLAAQLSSMSFAPSWDQQPMQQAFHGGQMLLSGWGADYLALAQLGAGPRHSMF